MFLRYGRYLVKDSGFGLEIRPVMFDPNESTKTVWLSGDDATLCRDELADLFADLDKPGTRASRFTPDQLADEILAVYFD